MANFEIVTKDGETYIEGEKRRFDFRDVTAVLLSVDDSGDYLRLEYSDDIEVYIPEANLRYLAGVGLND